MPRTSSTQVSSTTNWVDVKAHGAKGDGTTDDTRAIQKAINSAKVVIFPPGTYLIARALRLSSNRVLVGAGIDATSIIPKGGSMALLAAVATGSTMLNIEIRGLQLASNGQSGIDAINLDGADPSLRISNVRLRDLLIVGCQRGIVLRLTANTFLDNVFCAICATGFRFDTCADTNLENCQAQNGGGTGFEIASAHVREGEGYRLSNCSTNGQGRGLTVTGQDWGAAAACSFTSCTAGAAAALADTTTWQFSACQFGPAGPFPAFEADAACATIQLSGCVLGPGAVGAALRGRRAIVSGCAFGPNVTADILLDGARHTVVSGNQCNSPAPGHSIAEMGAADYNAISGNVCRKDVLTLGAHSVAASNVVNYP